MKISSIVIFYIFLWTLGVHAAPYEVLVVGIADGGNNCKIEEFVKDAKQLNALHRKGYLSAKPYFNVLRMANGQVYLVFGFRGEVQGIHRENYPKTEKNLRGIKNEGVSKYPRMHWLPVEDIRRLLISP